MQQRIILGAIFVTCLATQSELRGRNLLDSSTLTKYVDRLPNPLLNPIAPTGTLDGAPLYEVSVSQFVQQLHRDLPPTTLWGYNNAFPGPQFVVQAGEAIKVRWTNNLVDAQGDPLEHILPYDTTLHGARGGGHGGHAMAEQARIVTHLHGGIVPADSDGYPEDWYTPITRTRRRTA